jgi:signal transduction histidine kinase
MWQDLLTKGYWRGEIWDKRKNGEIHAKFLTINTILNKEGEIYRYLAIFSDITAHKQYEAEIKRLSSSELNKAKLDAEKANRAKSDFLSSMSHELRTPMNAVLGFAQVLESEDLTEDQLDSVKEILTAGHHLLELINEVLDLSKIESDNLGLTLEVLDLKPILQKCLSLVQSLAIKNGIKIIDTISPDCQFSVFADELRIKQVLLNLISNAIKYNRVDGCIILSCEKTDSKTLKISVEDTGTGLSVEQLSKLFQPFERLNAKNSTIEGTGIGLVISKKLMEAMNGRIGVSSIEGKGSCFWIEIPMA